MTLCCEYHMLPQASIDVIARFWVCRFEIHESSDWTLELGVLKRQRGDMGLDASKSNCSNVNAIEIQNITSQIIQFLNFHKIQIVP